MTSPPAVADPPSVRNPPYRRLGRGTLCRWLALRSRLAIRVVDDANYALLNEYEITAKTLANLLAGNERSDGSLFAYRSTRSVASVIDVVSGRSITDRTDPVELAVFVLQTARLQAVKCAPRDTDHTAPYDAMYRPCWETFLQQELDLLRPRAILSLGRKFSQWVLHPLFETPTAHGDGVETTTLERDWGTVDVYTIYHPSGRGDDWERSHTRLLEVLREQQPVHY